MNSSMSARIIQKPHMRQTCRDLFRHALNIERGKRKSRTNKQQQERQRAA